MHCVYNLKRHMQYFLKYSSRGHAWIDGYVPHDFLNLRNLRNLEISRSCMLTIDGNFEIASSTCNFEIA